MDVYDRASTDCIITRRSCVVFVCCASTLGVLHTSYCYNTLLLFLLCFLFHPQLFSSIHAHIILVSLSQHRTQLFTLTSANDIHFIIALFASLLPQLIILSNFQVSDFHCSNALLLIYCCWKVWPYRHLWSNLFSTMASLSASLLSRRLLALSLMRACLSNTVSFLLAISVMYCLSSLWRRSLNLCTPKMKCTSIFYSTCAK